ncbi:MAG: alpha-L-fucosidase [Luteolibacter sp.]
MMFTHPDKYHSKPITPHRFAGAVISCVLASSISLFGFDLPDPAPIPTIPAAQAPGSVTMGNAADFPEVKMDFPIESGPFQPTWGSIANNYPAKDSAWLRQAKFGIWVHFGPQAAGQSGDWYARRMYVESSLNTYGTDSYSNHIADFGHPSTSGYKDLIRNWNPTLLDPAALTQTYHNAGARFLFVQGVHHDQYDNWNSKYQPWNSMNLGAHRDILGEWRTAIRAHADMRFGVAFHHEYSWWWWQSCYRSDTTNTRGKLGVPYDGNLTTNYDGTGQWWGTDPFDLRKLYLTNMREYAGIYNNMDYKGYNLPSGIFGNHLDYAHWYASWWALRMMDVIENYDPDFIYTDGNSTQPFSGYMSGTGYKADAMQRVLAHYFNRTLARRGTLDTFGIVKFNPNNKGIVNTFENNYPADIKTDQPWIGEVPVGDWFYNTGFNYNPNTIIRYLLECVSRDGAAAICIALKPDGSLDPGSVTQLQGVGNWMNINSPGIYGSKAWVKFGEGTNKQATGALGSTQANQTFTNADFRYTVGADGYLYAYCMTVPAGGAALTLPSLGTGDGNLAAPITTVSLLGSNTAPVWSQTATDLNITCPASMSGFQTSVCFKIGPPAIIKLTTPDLTAASKDASIGLQWKTVSANATYTIKRATSSAGPFTTLATGLTGTSYEDTTVQPGTLYFYTASATDGASNSAESPSALGILAQPSTWLSRDLTKLGEAGSVIESDGIFVVKGSGSDIWGNSDEFRFVYKPLTGDGSITTKVESVQNTGGWAKAGVMIRETLATNSKYAGAYVSPSNGTAFQQRTTTGGSASGVGGTAGLVAPYWLRLIRSGSTITAYQSVDGLAWSIMGTTTVSMTDDVYIGMAVCSVNNGTLNQSVFSNLTVADQTSPQPTVTPGNGNVMLRWNTVSGGVSGYRIKRSTSPGGPFTTVVSSTPGTSYIDAGLTNGTPYYYIISSLVGGLESADSAVVSGTPTSSVTLVSRAVQGIAAANAEKITELASMAFDGSTSTKWYTDINASTGWLRYQFGAGLAWRITQYQVTSANDVSQRDPKDWQFQGSNNGSNWTTLDTQTGQTFATRLLTKTYNLVNNTPHRFYRLNITANNGGSGYPIQLSEFSLWSAPSDVGDKNLPVLSLPANMTVDAPDSMGAVVNFTATAVDGESGVVTVVSQPASGSLFPAGLTTVQCAATDMAGNTASGTFTVTANTPVMTWRIANFGTSDNSGNAADSADPDGDGWTNQQEFVSGTDPQNRASLLKLDQMQAVGNDMRLSFPTVVGKTYRLERSDTLTDASWTTVQADIAGTGVTIQVADPNGAGLAKRFYRIVVQ